MNLNLAAISYSSYSAMHQTYSRIDYYLISAQMLNDTTDCSYHSIVISDHAALSLSYKINNKYPKWRFQTGWLHEPEL